MSEGIIQADALVKNYQMGKTHKVPVLRGLSFQIAAGDRVALHGPSGSGKSTLLHLLGAMDRPTSGTLMIEGKDIGKLNDAERAEYRAKTVGMVFQSFNLLPHLTARQNVLMPAILAGTHTAETAARADQLLERVGLKDRMNHRPSELSGGEQQRVAIVRALINKPKLILADEPTGNLDQTTGHEIMHLLLELSQADQSTLVVVTHDKDVASHMQQQFHLVDGQLTRST